MFTLHSIIVYLNGYHYSGFKKGKIGAHNKFGMGT